MPNKKPQNIPLIFVRAKERLKYILTLLITFILYSCAQFVPPTGGPKDEEPPEIIERYPENETLSFKDNTITLEFNELIDATTLRQELIITPQPEGSFDIKVKPYGVELKFDEPFVDSTTYTFNFRAGIKDLNEKNPATNLKVVFSTGTEIDSLAISGKITYLWNGTSADEILVGLYDLNTDDTLPILQRKPNYFIKTDTSGVYEFENIKASDYRVLGFKDGNLNLLFDNKTENFGFIADTIKLDTILNDIDFAVYPNNTDAPKVRRTLSRQANYSVTFDKSIKNIEVQFLEDQDSLTYQIRDKELLFFNNPTLTDTTLTRIIVTDSIGNSITDTLKVTFSKRALRNEPKPESLTIRNEDIRNNAIIKLPTDYLLNFEFPVSNIDTSKITILSDTTYFEDFNLEWLDDSQTKLQITFDAKATWEIKLKLESGAITNYNLDTNNTYQLINKVYQQEDFGALDGSYDDIEGQKIIELLDARSFEVIDAQIFTNKYSFPEALPGTYRIRIIEDLNKNGQWDTADFETNKLPERIVLSKGTIKLKANFELSDIVID